MQIRSSLQARPTAAPPKPVQTAEQQTEQAPADNFQQSEQQETSDPRKKLFPAMLALGGAAAGLVGGFSNGVAGGIGGAVSLGVGGAAAATVVGAFEEFSGTSPDYQKRAIVGGALGAAFGGLIGGLSQSGAVAAGLTVAGALGATLGYAFLND